MRMLANQWIAGSEESNVVNHVVCWNRSYPQQFLSNNLSKIETKLIQPRYSFPQSNRKWMLPLMMLITELRGAPRMLNIRSNRFRTWNTRESSDKVIIIWKIRRIYSTMTLQISSIPSELKYSIENKIIKTWDTCGNREFLGPRNVQFTAVKRPTAWFSIKTYQNSKEMTNSICYS